MRAGEFSSLELLEFYLDRIARLNGPLNAVVTLDADGARAKARRADARLERGESGVLLGLPVTIKDAYEVAGIRTTGGSPMFRDHVPESSATAIERIESAGAIVFGKTNVPLFSGDVQTFNEIFGVTNNPWNLERTPGGSSGGAAAAVACGFTAFEIGSDIGGSIRTPANWNGIYGHKTSWGLVPGRGHIPGPPGTVSEADLGVFGPLTRTADDLEFLLDIMAGPDAYAGEAWSLSLPPARHENLKDFRVAVFFDDEAAPLDAEVRHELDATVAALHEAGATVDEQARPVVSLDALQENYFAMLAPIMAAGLSQPVLDGLAGAVKDGDPKDPGIRFAMGAVQTHREWLVRHERRVRLQHQMKEFFTDYDVLLCPSGPVAAIPHDHGEDFYGRRIRVNGKERGYVDLLAWITLASLAGLPATVAPIGRTKEGLPVGLQIIGPPLEDRTSIAFARALASVTKGYEAPPHARAVQST
jgi:amidase